MPHAAKSPSQYPEPSISRQLRPDGVEVTESWKWPGSRWWRVDLHTHTPESHDFKDDRDNPDWERWVRELRDRGIHAVAVTDHNTGQGIPHVQQAAEDSGLIVFPGVELTIDGVHLLVIVDPSCQKEDVGHILSRANVPVNKRGRCDAHASISILTLLEELGSSAVVIAAHVNGPKGLLRKDGIASQERIAILRNRSLAAVEIDPALEVDEKWIDGTVAEVSRRLTKVWGSDGHCYSELGRRYTWLKMTAPSLDGLRLALEDGSLEDGSSSARSSEELDPNKNHASAVIESISIAHAKHIGQPHGVTFPFNPWLNAIIGGRGTGKSTLVDLCRLTLRRENELPDSYEYVYRYIELNRHM